MIFLIVQFLAVNNYNSDWHVQNQKVDHNHQSYEINACNYLVVPVDRKLEDLHPPLQS